MTTSSTNNSVFRGFFKKQKLTEPNFIDWYRQLRIMLSIEDKLNYPEQPIPPVPIAPAASKTGASLDYERFSLLQAGRRANYNMHRMGKTVNELHAMLKLHEQTLPKTTLLLLMLFEQEVENQLGKTIKSLRSDQGGKYMSQDFLDHLKDRRIIAHRTPPYTPQHNGVLERRNRTLLDMVRSIMSQTTLPKSFWDYVLETAASILNMVPTKKALIKLDTLTKTDKLEPKAIKCIYVGYPKEMMGYSFYYPPENKVLVARNAEFLENIQEEDMYPSLDTSLNHEEEDLEIDESQSDIVPIRRSTRTRHAPNRVCLYIDAEEHELGDLGEPANYKGALLDLKSEKWLNAMNVEMQSMKDSEVWFLVDVELKQILNS
nr:hypothetical protein [Tanacetum cinerariifolium]